MAPAGVDLNVSDFVHLHNHTQHSLLDGLSKIPKLIEMTAEMGMKATAITDHGTLSGVLDFFFLFIKNHLGNIICRGGCSILC